MKPRTFILAIGLITLLACGVAALVFAAGDGPPQAPTKTMLQRITSDDQEERDAQVQQLLDNREQTIELLCTIVDQKNAANYTPEVRAAAAYVLGRMRAAEAVTALNSALADDPVRRLVFDDRSPYDGAVSTALLRIGRPAVPEMIKNLQQSDDKRIREKTCTILYHILGGRDHVVALIDRLIGQERNLDVRKRLAAARAYVLTFYRDSKPPLY